MTRREIEDLFKTEDYDKAVLKIKNALKDDSDNGELIYYLFLAENKDYANIDLDNIVNEVNFNRAIELSNRRLRNEFEAEYNFYRDSDPQIRKLFCYASRGNIDKVLKLFDKINDVKLPENIDEYIDNLDYIVTLKTNRNALKLNILSVNLLYILVKDGRLLKIINNLLNIIKQMDFKYNRFVVFSDKSELKEYIFDDYESSDVDEIQVIDSVKAQKTYLAAMVLFNIGLYQEAMKMFKKISYYNDSLEYINKCKEKVKL